jgi:hypothetical protein
MPPITLPVKGPERWVLEGLQAQKKMMTKSIGRDNRRRMAFSFIDKRCIRTVASF